jgi:NADPH:quinone reductase-like Zn-dependent oxidoreductase
MKVIQVGELGGDIKFNYTAINLPVITDHQVLVKVHAISINPVDYKARKNQGTRKFLFGDATPIILGWDISGTITAVGKNVVGFSIGDEVFGMVNFPGAGNAYAEYVAVRSAEITHKPDNITHMEAAAATLAALTAWQVTEQKAKVQPGQKVLVLGAAGGVGHYAVQMARYAGAFVIGTSSAKNKDFVLGLGADQHIDYTLQQIETVLENIDLVIDTVGGEAIAGVIQCTRNGGQIVSIPSGNINEKYLALAAAKQIDLSFLLVKSDGEDMQQIASLLKKGIIRSQIASAFSFDEMEKAHAQLETGRTVGKIVIQLIS